jgi:uncharacterized protein YjbI with pentapeptide repeats
MPRYFFHTVAGDGRREDFEGSDLQDLEQARLKAIKDARAMMSDAILDGRDISSRHMEVCNELGKILLKVRFRDAVTGEE